MNEWSKVLDFLQDTTFSCARQKNGALWSVAPPDSPHFAAGLMARKKRHLTPHSCVAYSTVCMAWSHYLHSKRIGKVLCLCVCFLHMDRSVFHISFETRISSCFLALQHLVLCPLCPQRFRVFIILVLSWVPKEAYQQLEIRWLLTDFEASVFVLWYREQHDAWNALFPHSRAILTQYVLKL